jgi:hypothetical protein
VFGRGAGDCPETEVENNVIDVNTTANESLMYVRGIDMVNLHPKPSVNDRGNGLRQLAKPRKLPMTWRAITGKELRLLVKRS